MGDIHKAGTDDGWHAVIEKGGKFEPEKDRYHLYIGLFCPFAHRVNLVRHLKGLTSILPISTVLPYPKPWQFPTDDTSYPNATVDALFHSTHLSAVYFQADPAYTGRYSVPLIWDIKLNTAVSNESAEILRWLPNAFNGLLEPEKAGLDFYPEKHKGTIDVLTPFIQSYINAGVYKAGFAKTQDAYNEAIPPLFGALNFVEQLVARNGGPYVLGKELTELDIRLYATIVRFDVVYVQHFKCDLGSIRGSYPMLNNWLKGLYWGVKGFRESTDWKHIKENYTKSHADINPLAITPLGPYPHIEEGYEKEWTKVKPGSIEHPQVLEWQKKFEQEIKL
ncbi:hypothetical protein EJ05DRAFT_485033 [Pseudovirgaria hyperparasitica]|uniref:GST N-terminal domain-containing protein n=1 Tax=Pseudovirgaria hyperparasitica TaxID=470096 RepID=A0A6A6WAT7_9PEZI|nr:uncharacterized protein EJ05DRAFT_485033 [Pseudovirgaria hyperparasitica]KAF2758946.1 hypothetical protein EJ05DRAFT_485033 [Pseudovirgaria hyperparasitica]